MGNDEHGPAYPDHDPTSEPFHDLIERRAEPGAYRCPICNGGENRYMECEYPGCPDGRDQSRFAMLRATYEPEPDAFSGVGKALGWIGVLILLAYLLSH